MAGFDVATNGRFCGGHRGSSSGAQTVLNQAQQALQEPHTDRSTGREDKVHTVYIISPHECTTDAIENIKTALRDRARQVEFICGVDLLALFQDYWPDFLRFESTVLSRYLADLRKGLSTDAALITLLTRHNANLGIRPFESFYVPNAVELRLDLFESPRTAVPRATAFDKHLTRSELDAIISKLKFWRVVFRSPELTATDSETLQELNRFIDRFLKDLKTYWDRALRTKRQRDFASSDVEERLLEVPPEGKDKYAASVSLMTRIDQQIAKIHAATSELQHAARSMTKATAALVNNANLIVSSSGYDYLSALPGLIKCKPGKILTIEPEMLFSNCRAVLVSGPPGSGKTSFCRWQTIQAIEQFSVNPSNPLPIYIPAHRLATARMNNFEEAFLGGIEADRQQASIRLFLDGLDEVPDREQQRQIVELLKNSLNLYGKLSVVITSRPYVWGHWLNWLPRVHISGLQLQEQRRLATKWLSDQPQVQTFFKELESSPSLSRLMSVPLLATLILNLYRKTPTIPENKAALYRSFVDLYCGGWDSAKGVFKAGKFRNEQKLRPLSKLAYRMHASQSAECSEHVFFQAVSETMPAFANSAEFLTEIIQDGILVRAGRDLVFAHLSFQEFLAAQFLASDPTGERPRQVLRAFLQGDDWWKEVIEFYIISRDDPTAIDDWIKRANVRAHSSSDLAHRLDRLASVLQDAFTGFRPTFNR